MSSSSFLLLFIFGCAGSSLLRGPFPRCGEWGSLSGCCTRLLTVVAALVAGHTPEGVWVSVAMARGLSSCGSQALEHRLGGCGAWA